MAFTIFVNGEVANATEVIGNFNFNTSQIMYNAVDSSRTSDDDERYFTSTYSAIDDYASSTCFKKGAIAFCTVLDNFDDASIDANIWTSSASGGASSAPSYVTESGSTTAGVIKVFSSAGVSGGSASLEGDQVNAIDIRNMEVLIRMGMSGTASNNPAQTLAAMKITDGATDITIKSLQAGPTEGGVVLGTKNYRMVINATTEELHLYEGLDDTVSSTIDLSTLNNAIAWNILFTSVSTGNGGSNDTSMTTTIYGIGYLDGTAGTSISQTSAQTISSSTSGFIYNSLSTNNVAYTLSFDNGSNYSTASPLEWATIDVGTQLIFKNTGTHEETLDLTDTGRNIEYVETVYLFYS